MAHKQIERVARYKLVINLFPTVVPAVSLGTRLHELRSRRKCGCRTVVPGNKRVHLALNADGDKCKRGPPKR
jgi:hypothetical protein